MEKELALLLVIVNNGYGEEAIELLKEKGARGATIINGTGAVKPEAKKLYGIEINPEKEVLLVVVTKDLLDSLMQVRYEKLGSTTLAQGIAFSLPISYATSNLYNQFKNKIDKKEESGK